jgi:hypothetical protein
MDYCSKCRKLGFLPHNDTLCFRCNEAFYNEFSKEYAVLQEPIKCRKCGKFGYVYNYDTFCWKCTDIYTINNRVYIGPYRCDKEKGKEKEKVKNEFVSNIKTSNRYRFLDEN